MKKGDKIYAGKKSVQLFENNNGSLFVKSSPKFNEICIEGYRKILSAVEASKINYQQLSFSAYSPSDAQKDAKKRTWLPTNYIGVFTGKIYKSGNDTFLQISFMANKRALKQIQNKTVGSVYTQFERLGWVNEIEITKK